MPDDAHSPVLVATDCSSQAGAAARWGQRLAEHLDAPVVATYVVEISFTNWYEGEYEVLDDPGKREETRDEVLEWYRAQVGEAPDEVDIRVGTPHRKLAEAARHRGAGMLVVSVSGKSGLKQVVFGSTSLELTRKPPCPLAVVHPEHEDPEAPGDLLVGTDLSPFSERAVQFAARLAHLLNRDLHVVHSSRPARDFLEGEPLLDLPHEQELLERRGNLLKDTLDRHAEDLQKVTVHSALIDERPGRGLPQYLDDHEAIDITILSDRFHGGEREALLSSVALKCVHLRESTVIVVPDEQA